MNWKSMIRELLDAGLTQREIADAIGVTQSTVSQVLGGKSGNQRGFRFEPGQRLVELHRRTCGSPMENSPDSSDDVQPPAGMPDRKEGD